MALIKRGRGERNIGSHGTTRGSIRPSGDPNGKSEEVRRWRVECLYGFVFFFSPFLEVVSKDSLSIREGGYEKSVCEVYVC